MWSSFESSSVPTIRLRSPSGTRVVRSSSSLVYESLPDRLLSAPVRPSKCQRRRRSQGSGSESSPLRGTVEMTFRPEAAGHPLRRRQFAKRVGTDTPVLSLPSPLPFFSGRDADSADPLWREMQGSRNSARSGRLRTSTRPAMADSGRLPGRPAQPERLGSPLPDQPLPTHH